MAQTQTPARRVQSEGDQIDYTPVAPVYAGDIVVVNGTPLLADIDIPANVLGALSREGVWQVPKVAGAIAPFDPVYWSPTGNPVVGTAGTGAAAGSAAGEFFMGYAAAAAAANDPNVLVIPVLGAKSVVPTVPTETVAATGTTQADAAPIATGFTLVTGADAAKGVLLPDAPAGSVCEVKNGANAVLKVWPSVGDGINAVAVNGSLSMAANTSAVFRKYDAVTWYTVPLVPS